MGMDLAAYMKSVFADLEKDRDLVKAIRRLHMKEVHLRRQNSQEHLRLVRKARRLIQ